jgi:hypothetical protein
VPDRSQQLILADHTITVAKQVNKEIEDLRLDGHRRGSPAELPMAGVEHAIIKQVAQVLGPARFRAARERSTALPEEKRRES